MDGGDLPQTEARAGWPAPRGEPALGREALAAWRETAAALRARAEAEGLSMGEVARASGVPQGTLNPWYHGAYTGNYEAVTARLRRYLAAAAESAAVAAALPEAPGFVETPTARELFEALVYAQSLPEIAVVTLAAGCGKTTVARHFAATRPHVTLVTMRPSTAGRGAMLAEIAAALDVTERNPVRLDRAIGARLARSSRNTLLIVDEAQHLTDEAVNQLRFFHDEVGCGLALLGNEAVWRRWAARPERDRDGLAQIQSRIGYRILRRGPQAGDAEAAELRAAGRSYGEIAKALAAATGRTVGVRTVYRLVENARKRSGRLTVVPALSRQRAERAEAAAGVRGCPAPALIDRARALLLADPALLDAVLDDGVATPREET